MKTDKKVIGQTKSMGFQFGIRKSFPVSVDEAWVFMFSENGLKTWLGQMGTLPPIGEQLTLENGLVIRVRVFNPLSHIRMNWKKPEWSNNSILQVRIFGSNEKSTISFHQEKLLDLGQRSDIKAHWKQAFENIAKKLQ